MRNRTWAIRAASLALCLLCVLSGAILTKAAAPIWLEPGSTGSDVQLVQQLLYDLGYYTPKPNGTYDEATADAVLRFQTDYGLYQDGIVGDLTLSVMQNHSGRTFGNFIQPAKTAEDDLVIGTKGDEVRELQKKLLRLGYAAGPADGYFGMVTETALRQFQNDYGLWIDGVAGAQTKGALEEAYAQALASAAEESGLDVDLEGVSDAFCGLVQDPSSGTWFYVVLGKYTDDYTQMVLTPQQEAEGLIPAFCQVYARNVVANITTPDMTVEEKVAACFDFTMAEFASTDHPRIPHYTEPDWVYVYAYDMFGPRHGGNCFSFAAAFSILAKACGCEEVYACNSGGHGWTEIDGLVYDPEMFHDTDNKKIYAYPYSDPLITDYWPAISDWEKEGWKRVSIPAF